MHTTICSCVAIFITNYIMPYVGELVIDTVSAKVKHTNVIEQPKFATVDQVVSMSHSRVQNPPLETTKGNLVASTNSLDILKEVSQALDELKLPTKRIKTSKDPGFTGDVRHDSEYLYICVSTNNWKRIKLESF